MNGINILSALVGSSLIFWIVIGLITHAKWIQELVQTETEKINKQNLAIEQYGYTSISSTNRKFYAKRGFVFGYWDNDIKSVNKIVSSQDSPKIFDLAGINLIVFTSIFFLIAVSKGFFNIVGIH